MRDTERVLKDLGLFALTAIGLLILNIAVDIAVAELPERYDESLKRTEVYLRSFEWACRIILLSACLSLVNQNKHLYRAILGHNDDEEDIEDKE